MAESIAPEEGTDTVLIASGLLLLSLGLVLTGTWSRRKWLQHKQSREQKEKALSLVPNEELATDVVDEASLESFPASDAPAW